MGIKPDLAPIVKVQPARIDTVFYNPSVSSELATKFVTRWKAYPSADLHDRLNIDIVRRIPRSLRRVEQKRSRTHSRPRVFGFSLANAGLTHC